MFGKGVFTGQKTKKLEKNKKVKKVKKGDDELCPAKLEKQVVQKYITLF